MYLGNSFSNIRNFTFNLSLGSLYYWQWIHDFINMETFCTMSHDLHWGSLYKADGMNIHKVYDITNVIWSFDVKRYIRNLINVFWDHVKNDLDSYNVFMANMLQSRFGQIRQIHMTFGNDSCVSFWEWFMCIKMPRRIQKEGDDHLLWGRAIISWMNLSNSLHMNGWILEKVIIVCICKVWINGNHVIFL